MKTPQHVTLYEVLEKILKQADKPMDCVALFEQHAEVRELAASANRVSDYLGNMWRKGDLLRVPGTTQPGSKARWLYAWKGRNHTIPSIEDIRKSSMAAERSIGTLLSRPNLEITQDGKVVTLTMPNLTITIKAH